MAKHSLSSAQVYERHAVKKLVKSIDELEDSLSALAGDSQPLGNGKEGEDDQDEIEWADINADGIIDTMDFNILAQHWLDSYDMDE